MSIIPKAIYSFSAISINIPTAFFTHGEKSILKFFYVTTSDPDTRAILGKNKLGVITLPDLELNHNATV